jgi:hypothetical protein
VAQCPRTRTRALIRRYIETVDANESDDWSVLDEYIAEGFRRA